MARPSDRNESAPRPPGAPVFGEVWRDLKVTRYTRRTAQGLRGPDEPPLQEKERHARSPHTRALSEKEKGTASVVPPSCGKPRRQTIATAISHNGGQGRLRTSGGVHELV